MIGVFDSGVGGLSVWRAIVDLLPQESTLYLADQAHVPYGPRPEPEIRALAQAAVSYLVEQGADVVVVACNTATSAALPFLRAAFAVPIVGMEPALKPAVAMTRSGKAGVLATAGTLAGERFAQLQARYAAGTQVLTQAAPKLVTLVEQGQISGPAAQSQVAEYVQPLVAAGVDVIVLGCTHFPFLAPLIRQSAGPEVIIVDPAYAVARQTARLLCSHPQSNSPQIPKHRLATTGDPQQLHFLVHVLSLEPLLGKNRDIFGINLDSQASFAHAGHLSQN